MTRSGVAPGLDFRCGFTGRRWPGAGRQAILLGDPHRGYHGRRVYALTLYPRRALRSDPMSRLMRPKFCWLAVLAAVLLGSVVLRAQGPDPVEDLRKLAENLD